MRNTKDHVLADLDNLRAKVDSARVRMWDHNYEEALHLVKEARRYLDRAEAELQERVHNG